MNLVHTYAPMLKSLLDGLLWIHSLSSSEQSALNLTRFLLTENFYSLHVLLQPSSVQ